MLGEIEEYYYKKMYGMPYYDTDIKNKTIIFDPQCTITTIQLHYDKNIQLSQFIDILEKKQISLKNDTTNNTRKCMKKSITFSINYDTSNKFKLKIFNKGSIQLNGVCSTDDTYIQNIVQYIKNDVLSGLCYDTYQIIMSNYKINQYLKCNETDTLYGPIPRMKSLYNKLLLYGQKYNKFAQMIDNIAYNYDLTCIEFTYQGSPKNKQIKIKYSCYCNLLVQGNINTNSKQIPHTTISWTNDNFDDYIDQFCNASDIDIICAIIKYINKDYELFIGCYPL